MTHNWRLGLACSMLTATLWGLLPIALKGLLPVMDALTISWYRMAAAGAICLAWYGHRSGPALKCLLSGKQLAWTLVAIGGLISNYLLYLFGLDHTTASAAQVVIQLAPMLLLLASVVRFREPFSTRQWFGVALFTAGLPLFFHLRLSGALADATDSGYALGVLLVVLASFTWALYGVAQKQLILQQQSSQDILLLVYLAATLVLLPLASPLQALQLDGQGWLLLLFAVLNTVIAYAAFGWAMSCWESSRVSATLTVAPLFTLLFAQLVAHWQPDYMAAEAVDGLSLLGACLVVGGSAIAALASRKIA